MPVTAAVLTAQTPVRLHGHTKLHCSGLGPAPLRAAIAHLRLASGDADGRPHKHHGVATR